MAFFDLGSDNSWIDASLSRYALTKQTVKYKVNTMLGSGQSEAGEVWNMRFVLPDGTTKQATLLKSNHFQHTSVSKIQRQLISCPVTFVTKHNLDEKLHPIMKYNEEQVVQTENCQALMLLGKNMLFAQPRTIDYFEAQESKDNIQNFIMLLENKMVPEVLLVGQQLEIPAEVSCL